MKDINGEEFFVGDTLKVIKAANCGIEVQVGDVLRCIKNDGDGVCKFQRVGDAQILYYPNEDLQKL